MTEPKPSLWQQALTLERQREAQSLGRLGMGATGGGPQPAQEAQAAAQEAKGTMSPGEAATAAGAAAAGPGVAAAQAQQQEFREHPYRTAATIAGGVIGAGIGSGVLRLANGLLLRAGSPLLSAGSRIFPTASLLGRATGAALGSVEGSDIGTALDMTPETSPEASSRRLWAGALGAGAEVAAPVGIGAVRTLRSIPGVGRRILSGEPGAALQFLKERVLGTTPVTHLAPLAEEVQKALVARGETATMGQLSTAKRYQMLEAGLQAAYSAQGNYSAQKSGAQRAAVQAWRDALPAWGRDLSQEDVGRVVDDALLGLGKRKGTVGAGASGIARAVTNTAYEHARQVAADAGVRDNIVPIDDIVRYLYNDQAIQTRQSDPFAKAIKEEIERLVDPEAIPIIRSSKGTTYAPITFEQAEALRSTMNGIAYGEGPELIAGTKKLAVPYAQLFEKAMDDAVNALGVPEVKAAYQAARDTSTMQHDLFGDVLAGLVGKTRKEQIGQTLAASGTPSNVKALWAITDKPEYQQAFIDAVKPFGGSTVQDFRDMVANNYLNERMRQAGLRASTVTGETLKEAKGARLLDVITGDRGMFEAVMPDPARRHNLEVLAQAEAVSQRMAKSRVGSFMLQFYQASAVAGALEAGGAQVAMGFNAPAIGALAGWIALPWGLSSVTTTGAVNSWLLRRAMSAPVRMGQTTGRIAMQAAARWVEDSTAQLVSKLRDAGVPFEYHGPDGQVTVFDPKQGPQGPFAPTAAGRAVKPTMKTEPTGR